MADLTPGQRNRKLYGRVCRISRGNGGLAEYLSIPRCGTGVHMKRQPRLLSIPALVLTLGVATVTSGCARAARLAKNSERTFCAKSTATVYVQNDNWLDVVIYVVRGGSRYRLGQVSSLTAAKFEIPPAAVGATGDIYLLADPIGAVSSYAMYSTDDIMIPPGHTIIELRVDNVISHSAYTVGVEDASDI